MKAKDKESKAIEVMPKLIPTKVQPMRFYIKGIKIVAADNNLKRIYKIEN